MFFILCLPAPKTEVNTFARMILAPDGWLTKPIFALLESLHRWLELSLNCAATDQVRIGKKCFLRHVIPKYGFQPKNMHRWIA